MNKITCYTLFDITHTGVLNHYKSTAMPFKDRSGTDITTDSEWRRSRNQQRNWETIIQVLSLRTQPMELTDPELLSDQSLENYQFGSAFTGTANVWKFEFEIEQEDVFADENSRLGKLCQDLANVPMLDKLLETVEFNSPMLTTDVTSGNIYFIAK